MHGRLVLVQDMMVIVKTLIRGTTYFSHKRPRLLSFLEYSPVAPAPREIGIFRDVSLGMKGGKS